MFEYKCYLNMNVYFLLEIVFIIFDWVIILKEINFRVEVFVGKFIILK